MLAKHLEKKEQEGGFTLVELLVVILIIGILAAVAIPAFLNQRKRANDSAVESDVKNLATQIESALVTSPNATSVATTAVQGPGGTATVEIQGADDVEVTLSDGVVLEVAGDSNGYTITAGHTNGDQYKANDTGGTPTVDTTDFLKYDSAAGGLAN